MTNRPKLTNPPLIEVACGVVFEPLALGLAQISDLRQAMRDVYPMISLQPALVEPNEQLHFTLAPGAQMMFGERAIMESSDGGWIVQLQHNRLFVNWRSQGGSYPGMYDENSIVERFLTAWAHLAHLIGEIKPKRVEITKVNHLYQGLHWSKVDDLVELLPMLQGLRNSQRGPELHFNLNLNDNSELPQQVVNARTLRRLMSDGEHRLLVHMELSTRAACADAGSLRESLTQTNEALNEHFFSLIPPEQWARFGGLIQ